MIHRGASSRSSVLSSAGLALLLLLVAPARAGSGTPVFLDDFEFGLCAWSSVVTPESCDGMDNDCDTLVDEDGVCMACGDGFIIPGVEECDDAPPAESGDGCSDSCTIEHGFQCSGEPSACFSTCGDAVVATGVEGCDDGNLSNGDGCSATCNPEHAFYCAGEPSVCYFVCGDGLIAAGFEACDDAPPAEDGDGCSATCNIEGGWQCSGEPSACVPL